MPEIQIFSSFKVFMYGGWLEPPYEKYHKNNHRNVLQFE